MLLRCSYLLVMVLALASQAGCCCGPWGGCWPDGKSWCGSECGGCFWHEWFSLPPDCCDPCDDCGCYVGPRLNDDLYSHGNDYTGYGERQPEPVRTEPVRRPAPARSTEPYTPRDTEPYTLPGPSDEMPLDSSTEVLRGNPGRRVSYDEPMARDPRAAQPVRLSEYARAAFEGPVDSRRGSRTLGKLPRTRLFSR